MACLDDYTDQFLVIVNSFTLADWFRDWAKGQSSFSKWKTLTWYTLDFQYIDKRSIKFTSLEKIENSFLFVVNLLYM